MNTCDGSHYGCGETANWKTGISSQGNLSQTRNRKTSFLLGATEVVVNKEVREFNIQYSGGYSFVPNFIMKSEDGLFACGGATVGTTPHAVSESYECTNTVLNFLDLRYNNAFGKEIIEKITFSEAGSAVAGFKETWGLFYYPKFVITNHKLSSTTNYFIIVNGVKTILKTVTTNSIINGPSNPLILVFPNPPSLAIPWINVDDIKTFGFYDYHAGSEDEGQAKIRQDGGDDFYFTDWMRNVGNTSLAIDQADADNRYFDFYLHEGVSGATSYFNPGINIDSTPLGSICVDAAGNVCYSMLLNGQRFNFLTNGDLPSLTGLDPAGFECFPVGLV